MIDLNDLANKAYITAKKREKNGANIKTEPVTMLLKHCAGEVVEATEACCNYADALCSDSNSETLAESRENFENEVADIIVCCLIVSGYSMIDIEKALNRVMRKNKKRAEKQGDKL